MLRMGGEQRETMGGSSKKILTLEIYVLSKIKNGLYRDKCRHWEFRLDDAVDTQAGKDWIITCLRCFREKSMGHKNIR